MNGERLYTGGVDLTSDQFEALLAQVQADLPGQHQYLMYTLGDWKLRVLESHDCPYEGLTTYCTVGLADHEFAKRGAASRYELVCGSQNGIDLGPVLAKAAEYMRRFDLEPYPFRPFSGLFRDARVRELADRLPHAIFTPPFPWADDLKVLNLGGATVRVVFCMPSKDEEVALLKRLGESAFNEQLYKAKVDVMDPLRPSFGHANE